MSIVDDAKAFVQGEVGKFLAIPATLTDIGQRIAALAATPTANAGQVATWQQQVSTLQGRYQVTQGEIQAVVAAVQSLQGGTPTWDQVAALAQTVPPAVADTTGLLRDVDTLQQQVNAAYYGAGGPKAGVPSWVWWIIGGVGVWGLWRGRHRR